MTIAGMRRTERVRFVARENRFVVRVERTTGQRVTAYLPNTARLTDVLVPGATLVAEHSDDPHRRTRWTVTRVWDGTWVSLEASRASALVAGHLEAGGALPGWPPARAVRREVTHTSHRFDLAVELDDGRSAVVEVKSLSRARGGVAPLSGTPSTRGVAHLAALATMARAGDAAAVTFVVQRADAEVLDLAAPADAAWVDAVRDARRAGVHVVAFACDVDEERLALGDPIPVRDGGADPRGAPSPRAGRG